jgi:hypothetical protein
MSLQQNAGGRAMVGVFGMIIGIIFLLIVGSLTWLFPIELIRMLQLVSGALIIISLATLW